MTYTARRYTKRALLVGVYSATELYMVNDCSPGGAGLLALTVPHELLLLLLVSGGGSCCTRSMLPLGDRLTSHTPPSAHAGYADTWAALDRRLSEALELGKATQDASALADALGGAAGAVLAQIGGLLGGSRRPGPPL